MFFKINIFEGNTMARKRKTPYLNNKDLLKELLASKELGKMNNELAKMLMTLVKKYAKSPQFSGYSYREDMEAFALMMLTRTWMKFDENRSTNVFAWATQCSKNSFIHYLKYEKKHRNIRDASLVGVGLNPSNTYMREYEESEKERHALQEEIEHPDPPKEKETPLYE